MKMKRSILLLITVTLMCTACFDRKTELEPLLEEEVTLKILTDAKGNAENRYLEVFKLYFPNVTPIFIDEGAKEARESGEWAEWFKQHQPDLIMMYPGRNAVDFKQQIEEQLFEPLEPYILRDGYSFEHMVLGAIEWLRMQSQDNQLYALANGFYNEVIFYNTEHFDALNIPYPESKISWMELLQLVRLFQDSEDAIYGLGASPKSPLEILHEAAFAENLALLDVEKEEVYIRSAAWKEIVEEVVLTYQTGMITHQNSGGFPDDVAMILVNGHGEYSTLNNSQSGRYYKHWNVIHYPVNAFSPTENTKLSVPNPISIYSESPNKEHAWELLKFMTGPELARYELRARLKMPELPIWIHNLDQMQVEHVAAFYDAMPSKWNNPNYRPEIRPVQPLLEQYLDALIDGEMEIDQALEELEQKITELLEQGALQ